MTKHYQRQSLSNKLLHWCKCIYVEDHHLFLIGPWQIKYSKKQPKNWNWLIFLLILHFLSNLKFPMLNLSMPMLLQFNLLWLTVLQSLDCMLEKYPIKRRDDVQSCVSRYVYTMCRGKSLTCRPSFWSGSICFFHTGLHTSAIRPRHVNIIN